MPLVDCSFYLYSFQHSLLVLGLWSPFPFFAPPALFLTVLQGGWHVQAVLLRLLCRLAFRQVWPVRNFGQWRNRKARVLILLPFCLLSWLNFLVTLLSASQWRWHPQALETLPASRVHHTLSPYWYLGNSATINSSLPYIPAIENPRSGFCFPGETGIKHHSMPSNLSGMDVAIFFLLVPIYLAYFTSHNTHSCVMAFLVLVLFFVFLNSIELDFTFLLNWKELFTFKRWS